jgi:hypothetical protein
MRLPSPVHERLHVRNAAQSRALVHIDYQTTQKIIRYLVVSWLLDRDQSIDTPPDLSSFHGRNWFYPTWNWDAMRTDNFSWLCYCISHAQHYFHACLFDRSF